MEYTMKVSQLNSRVVEFLLLSHIYIYMFYLTYTYATYIFITYYTYMYVFITYMCVYVFLYMHANNCQGKVSAVQSLKEGEKRREGRWRERNKEWGERSLDERKQRKKERFLTSYIGLCAAQGHTRTLHFFFF